MKRLQRFLLLLVVLLLAFALAACGGDSGGDDDDSDDQDTTQPTDATSEDTEDGDGEDSGNNTASSTGGSSEATYEDEYGGVLTFTLPDGWIYDEGANRIGNSEAALAVEDYADLGEGQMIIVPGTIPFESPRMEDLNLNPRSAPVLILGALTREYDEAYSFGAARPNMMSGVLTGTIEGTYTAGESEFDVSISMFPKDDAFTTTVAHAPDGFIDGGVTGAIRTMMDSFEYVPGEMPEVSDQDMDATEEADDSDEEMDATEEAEPTEEAEATEES